MTSSELYRFGIKGQKWRIRRFQNKDGTLTKAGKKHRSKLEKEYERLTSDDVTLTEYGRKRKHRFRKNTNSLLVVILKGQEAAGSYIKSMATAQLQDSSGSQSKTSTSTSKLNSGSSNSTSKLAALGKSVLYGAKKAAKSGKEAYSWNSTEWAAQYANQSIEDLYGKN